MNPTIEQLAREAATDFIVNRPANVSRQIDILEQSYVSFLSACHAGPLKGVGEALESCKYDNGENWGSQHKFDESLVESALALLQSLQNPDRQD
jgi:hypothetical protein